MKKILNFLILLGMTGSVPTAFADVTATAPEPAPAELTLNILFATAPDAIVDNTRELVADNAEYIASNNIFFINKVAKNKYKISDIPVELDLISGSSILGFGLDLSTNMHISIMGMANISLNTQECNDFDGFYHKSLGVSTVATYKLTDNLSISLGLDAGQLTYLASEKDTFGGKTGVFTYGGFAKVNQNINLSDNANLNLYAAYLYGHCNSLNIATDGGNGYLNIPAINNHRIKLGSKLHYRFGMLTPFIGGSFERVLNNDFAITGVSSDKDPIIKCPIKLNGNRFALEAGTKIDFTKRFSGKISAEKYFGINKGFGGNLSLAYKW